MFSFLTAQNWEKKILFRHCFFYQQEICFLSFEYVEKNHNKHFLILGEKIRGQIEMKQL